MGFNLQAAIGGAAQRYSQRVDEQEEMMNRRMEYEWQIATKQRAERQLKREQEKAFAEESLGLLSMMGYDEETAAEIMKKGKGAVAFATQAGERALAKGMDVNTIFNFGVREDGTLDTAAIDETLDSPFEAPKAEMPELGKRPDDGFTPDLGLELGETPTVETPDADPIAEPVGFGVNQSALASLYGEPEKVESSYSARLAVISQKRLRTDDPAKIADLDRQRDALLADLKEMKAAEREDKPEDPNKRTFTMSALESASKSVLADAYNGYNLSTDLDGRIQGDIEGREPLVGAARLSAANTLQQTYGQFNDPMVDAKVDALRSNANQVLSDYGRRQVSLAQTDDASSQFKGQAANGAEVAERMRNGEYKVGDVITVPTKKGMKIIVYTGVKDVRTGQPFMMMDY